MRVSPPTFPIARILLQACSRTLQGSRIYIIQYIKISRISKFFYG